MEHFKVEINKLMDVCGGCERIKNTPIPFTYSVFIKKFIFLYVMIFPIVYSTQLNFLVAPVTMFVLYVLASIELIAEEIENPFNDDESDLPTEAMSKNIKISTEELLLNR
jgi:putative membrane protein